MFCTNAVLINIQREQFVAILSNELLLLYS